MTEAVPRMPSETRANGRHPDPTTDGNPGRRGDDGEQSARPVRVFIVDDHVLFRTGLRALLLEHGLDPVGDVGNAEQAVDHIVRLQPDVVLMDLSLPGMSAVEATRRVSSMAPDVSIPIFTTYIGEKTVVDAVEARARGYLVKDARTEDLVCAIEDAAHGQASLSPGATAVVLDRLRTYRFAPSSSNAAEARPRTELARAPSACAAR
jgi:DNA-binding NarL/FixJ family response regulator